VLGGAHIEPGMGMAGVSSTQLGKYQLLRRIATGGMAELFLARATAIHGFEKLVVLKRILPQHAESEDFIRMFLAEARLAATLHHPNIVQVYDIGEEEGGCFFTMEYVQGQDLRKLVRAARKSEKALPLEHILHIVMGVAAGLHHAHEKLGLDGRPLGIVHRDVSPSNVLVTYEGGVKIVDFGIAKATSAQSATIAGTLKGKIPYMSPEQCRGESVDRRSDIFSIGTLLWELTTGTRLFSGDNEFAIINRVAAGAVPLPTSIRPDYPPELEAIVMRALTADREQRYASALDLQIDLEDFAREARLPVSSARMGKTMRELFVEEIRQSTQMLQVDRLDEQPTMPRPALSREMLMGTSMPSMPSMPSMAVEPESVEVTPSEVRADGQATPYPASQVSYAAGSATDIHYEEEPLPRTSRVAVVLAVITGMVAVLGLSAAVWFFVLAEPPEAKAKPNPDLTPAVIVETPAPPEDEAKKAAPVVEPTPVDEGELVIEETATGLGEQAPAGASGASEAVEPGAAADVPVVDPTPTQPSPPPKDDKTEASTDDSGRSSAKRPSGKRTGTKSTSGSKPKWDPDSPFPI
jgi:serine/threonine protein kinase